MKLKILFSFLFLLAVSRMNAAPVTQQMAQTVALNFYLQSINPAGGASYTAVLSYTKMEPDNSIDFYVFDILPGNSYVIVSGDDRANPVIGYSPESYFDSNTYGSPFQFWMNKTAGKIQNIVQNNIAATSTITQKWNAYANGKPVAPATRGAVAPLLATAWDQEPYYNADCPTNPTDKNLCVTGCVATTMAQIMKYWNYPAQGTGSYSYTDDSAHGYKNNIGKLSANFGSTTYSWNLMPNSLSGSNGIIANLMYQCGVSVAMDYGEDSQGGSGSFVLNSEAPVGAPSAEFSYATYFSYNPKTLKGVFQNKYSESAWINIIELEINSGRPVQYEGVDSAYGGHTWVCDGYDKNNFLHMNWGWGGRYNSYYDVTSLNPNNGQYVFKFSDAALIGIEPLQTVKVTASAASSIICTGSSTQLSSTGPNNATYTWLPTAGLSCTTCASPVASPTVSTTYVVVADSNGIKGSYAVPITVATGITSSFTPSVTAACSAPASISFSNLSSNALTYAWDFGDGDTSMHASPSHTYTDYGTYTVKLVSTGPCGVSTANNQTVQVVNYAPTIISKDTQNICSGTTSMFAASGTGSLTWYDAASGGNLVASGDTLVSPVLTASKIYYVQDALPSPVTSCGPVNSSIGGGGFFTGNVEHGIVFNCLKPNTTLKSVDVKSNVTGQITIVLVNNVGNTLDSKTVNVVSGVNTVELDFVLPNISNLRLECSSVPNLFYNTVGVSYPYTSTDGSVTLTGSDAGNSSYYYFYNWKLFGDACITNRLPVHANILNGVVNFASSIQSNGVTVNFYLSDGSATAAHWDFGDGTTSDVKNPVHTFPARQSYLVTLTQTNGTCVASTSQTIALKSTGVVDVNADNLSFTIMPNPVSDNLQVLISGLETSSDYSLSVKNILGENVFTNNVHLDKAEYKTSISVSNIPAGVYFLQLVGVNGVSETRKFIKE